MGSILSGILPQNGYTVTQGTVVPGEQQALVNQLGAQASGQGPNPAQNEYQQNVNQAIQQASGVVASQKGISPALAQALAARIASQGTQQAAGNAATLQAKQQLSAQEEQANVLNQMNAANLAQSEANAGIAGQNTQMANNIIGGVSNAVGLGAMLNGGSGGSGGSAIQNGTAANSLTTSDLGFAKGGQVPPHLMEIASIYHPHLVQPRNMKAGGPVPGKAQVMGDSPKNDTVSAKLSPGEIVIPRSVLESKDPAEAAKQFVAKELMKKKQSGNKEEFKMALSQAMKSRKAK